MSISRCKLSCVIALSVVSNNAIASNEMVDVTEISLEQLLDVEVFTASKFNQKTSEAPSRVTVVDAAAIKDYGYRTLKDILASVPGLYTSYDRNYTYLGVRGLGLAGDYNTRILLLLDGQRVNDNVYDSFGADYDGIVNVDLIKRVEFSSGPGSAIYGANAFFGVVNIITKSADEIDGVQTSVDYASENSRRARVTAGKLFDNDFEAMISASAYKSDGADLYFPEFDDPTTNNGIAVGLDYHEAKNLFAKLKYKGFGFEAAYNERTKGIPTASYEQEFNMMPSETIDTVGLLALTYDAIIDSDSQLNSRLSFGRYDYRGNFIYDYPPLTVNRDETVGGWWNAELQYQTTYFDDQRIIVGFEYQKNKKQDQANFDVDPFESSLDDSRDGEKSGVYVQDEIRVTDKFILNAGIRYDHNHSDAKNIKRNIVNPRVALIYSVQPETTLKFIYGTAYRNANNYELYYSDAAGYLPSADLQPEEIETYEFDIEHYLYNNFKVSASIYSNTTENLIGLRKDINDDIFFDNLDKVTAQGGDIEAEYVADTGLRLRTSYSYVEAEDNTGKRQTNSPENMVKFNLSSPIFKEAANAGIEFQYMSGRITQQKEEIGGLMQQKEEIGGFGITNLTLSSKKIYDRLELSASIYNVFDKQYMDPVSEDHVQSSIVQDGRNFRIKATYTF